VNLLSQNIEPNTPLGYISLLNYNNMMAIRANGAMYAFNSLATAPRTYTLPDISDTITTTSNPAVLQNKTLVGGSAGNIVSANMLGGVNISDAVAGGLVLQTTSKTAASWVTLNSLVAPTAFWQIPIDLSKAVTSASYVNVTTGLNNGQLVYPGTTQSVPMNLSKVTFVAGADPNTFLLGGVDAVNGSVRIYDITNNKLICEINGIVNLTQTMYATTLISNLSTDAAIWQIQAKRTSAYNTNGFRPSGCLLQFN
jgi:hypothetical protein